MIGVEVDGHARAYPVSLLNSREMVVDRVGGVPILVTWCPVCATAMVDGEEIIFGTQGALYRNAMTWWDHDTGSIWSQPLGEAIAGPHKRIRNSSIEVTVTIGIGAEQPRYVLSGHHYSERLTLDIGQVSHQPEERHRRGLDSTSCHRLRVEICALQFQGQTLTAERFDQRRPLVAQSRPVLPRIIL